MELRGEIRRGYFVEGLSGMQFALPAVIGLLKSMNNEQSSINKELPLVVNACDPANPYGVGIEITGGKFSDGLRITRQPLNYFVLEKGAPMLWIENLGARISTVAEASPEAINAGLVQFISHLRSSHPNENEIIVEYCDGVRPTESPLAESLRTIGFYRDRTQTMRYELR
jgi:ATP-dependent Lhr-like helicase